MPLWTGSASLRQRRRRHAMQEVQHHAVELFEEYGFEGVTVEQVAEAAGVSPVSVYRWFGAKERLVLWDDYDPDLFAAIAERIGDRAPLEAVRDAVVAELGRVYDADRELVLTRTQLVHREPALLGAALRDTRSMRTALAELFSEAGIGQDDFGRHVLAEVAIAALTAAVDAWQAHDGQVALAEYVNGAFEVVRRATWTT
ncbi:MAG TPA: TetR family transcriptional regulator [Euzebya sp.]|nr:TetR family transcriptional regulator [Euzebya sp.]